MAGTSYLARLGQTTETQWWHDSADPPELRRGLEHGAVGVTTNPFLTALTLAQNRQAWEPKLSEVLAPSPDPETKAERLVEMVVKQVAEQLRPEYETTAGQRGYVCAQVNPHKAGDRDGMLAMARRFAKWAPNITVKLPATAAGLTVLEDATAEGLSTTATVSFTVPQVVAVAERYRRGMQRAQAAGITPRKCFAVIMIGRLDDYLREVAQDQNADVTEADIRQAGLAVTKRAHSIFTQQRYEAALIVAAMRGTYHLTELVGAKLIMSVAPAWQELFFSPDLPCEKRIHHDVPEQVVRRLSAVPDFVRAYEPGGMTPAEFISYGVTQRTLAQFSESGWKKLEALK